MKNKYYIYKITAIPIRSDKDRVEVLFFGQPEKHKFIEITNLSTYDTTFFEVNEYNTTDRHGWGLDSIILEKVQPGYYSICTWNETKNEQSVDIEFTILGETNREYLEKMAVITGKDTSQYPYKDIINNMSNNESHFLNVLITSDYLQYIQDDETEDIYKRFAMIKSIIDSINLAIRKEIDTDVMSLNYFTGEITCNSSVEKLMDLDITTLGISKKRIYLIPPTKNGDIIKPEYIENSFHIYLALNRKNEPLGVMFNFVPSQEILSMAWKEKLAINTKYNNMLERTISYPSSYMTFTEEEKEIVAMIKKIEPMYPMFKCPRVEYSEGMIKINISHGYDLLNMLDRDFYVSFREPELALDPTQWRRIKITNKVMNFFAQEICIVDETYLVWIEDKDGNVLSTVRCLNLKESFAGNDDEYYEYYDEESFEEKLRLLELYEYSRHMIKYIDITCPEHKEIINKVFSLAEEDNDTGKVDAAAVVTDGLCISKLALNFARMAKALYEDSTIYNKNSENLFHNNIKFYYKERKVAIPPEKNLLYVIDSYYVDRYVNRQYMNSPDETVNTYHTFYGVDFGVVWAIDKDTLQRSGFILIDFYNNKNKPKLYNYMVKTIEVVY